MGPRSSPFGIEFIQVVLANMQVPRASVTPAVVRLRQPLSARWASGEHIRMLRPIVEVDLCVTSYLCRWASNS